MKTTPEQRANIRARVGSHWQGTAREGWLLRDELFALFDDLDEALAQLATEREANARLSTYARQADTQLAAVTRERDAMREVLMRIARNEAAPNVWATRRR